MESSQETLLPPVNFARPETVTALRAAQAMCEIVPTDGIRSTLHARDADHRLYAQLFRGPRGRVILRESASILGYRNQLRDGTRSLAVSQACRGFRMKANRGHHRRGRLVKREPVYRLLRTTG